jgi:hypothetical protein
MEVVADLSGKKSSGVSPSGMAAAHYTSLGYTRKWQRDFGIDQRW